MTDLTNQYTPRMMAAAMRQYPRPTNFLMSMIGVNNNIIRTNKKYIELDKVFGNHVVAGFTDRQGEPHVVGKGSFENRIHVAPYYKERVTFTPSDVDTRDAGTTIYEDQSNQIDRMVARGLNELQDRLDRAEELQTAEALQTGQINVSGKDVNYTIDFGMKAGHIITLAGADRWTEATPPDMLGQMSDWAQLIEDTGAPSPEWVIGERSAMDNLIKNTNILAYLDNRRVERGEIDIRLIRGQRATYLGTLRNVGLDVDLYAYQGMYSKMDAGTLTNYRYMNTAQIIMGSSLSDVRKYYTKIENLKAGGFMADRFPHIYQEADGSAEHLQVESGPMVGLHQPDAFVTVITTS